MMKRLLQLEPGGLDTGMSDESGWGRALRCAPTAAESLRTETSVGGAVSRAAVTQAGRDYRPQD